MADINQVITLGIGTPASVSFFLRYGLGYQALGTVHGTLHERDIAGLLVARDLAGDLFDRDIATVLHERDIAGSMKERL